MNRLYRFITMAGIGALVSTAALADPAATPVGKLPDSGSVAVTGTVEKVNDEKNFTLRDDSGTVDVDIVSKEPVVLKEGDTVMVSGEIKKSTLGKKNIEATDVQVKKDLSSTISDTVTQHTDLAVDRAKSYPISLLPEEGLVKVSGTVKNVKDKKNFTLQDSTGTVKVTIQSEENAALTQGALVTVVGYVDSGFFSKDISATRVLIADAVSSREAQ